MPIPKPTSNQLKENKENEFVSACISKLSEEDKDKDQDEIIAICKDTWRRAKENKNSKSSIDPETEKLLANFEKFKS